MTSKDSLITKTGLKARGWTDSMVERFMPVPDETRENPHYRCASPMKLYCLKRVARVEKTKGFLAAVEKAKKRQQVAALVVEKNREKTGDYVRQVEIVVPKFSQVSLLDKAIWHFNKRLAEREFEGREFGEPASRKSDSQFLLRIAVNYLRHQMTDYESHLGQVAGRVGVGEAYYGIKKKVLEAIAAEYPWLAGECDRQWQEAVGVQVAG
jgi:hypothetical protein